MAILKYNVQQLEAIEAAVQWYKDFRDGLPVNTVFFLSGYAGTGKTSVAREIASRCCALSRVTYIAPTGKAASRLRDKGCAGAKTMHKFMYVMAGEFAGRLEFVEKGALDEAPLLIVCDESSMVGATDGSNLVGRGIPILALGDIGQLEPVGDDAWLVEGDQDYSMDIIERNGGNITRAAFFVRTGGRLPEREYEDVKVYGRRYTISDIERHTDENSVVLCSYNSTRQLVNLKARIALGLNGNMMPQVGEKLVCTFNQHTYNIMNGEQFVLLEIKDMPPEKLQPGEEPEFIKLVKLRSLTNDETKEAKLDITCFLGIDEDERNKAMKKVGGFDFGYALTIHKSQGSEWLNVMIIEEFMKGSPYHKLMYTAITRAIKHLTVFRAAN